MSQPESPAPTRAPRSIRAALSIDLMLSELQVMFTRRRTWAMLAAIALIPILLALAVYLSSDRLRLVKDHHLLTGSPKTDCSPGLPRCCWRCPCFCH